MDFRPVTAAALMLAASACAGPATDPPGAPAEPKIERLGQFLYMVPVARDERGCVVYRVESPFRRFDRALYWRAGEGDFTTDPTAATCV